MKFFLCTWIASTFLGLSGVRHFLTWWLHQVRFLWRFLGWWDLWWRRWRKLPCFICFWFLLRQLLLTIAGICLSKVIFELNFELFGKLIVIAWQDDVLLSYLRIVKLWQEFKRPTRPDCVLLVKKFTDFNFNSRGHLSAHREKTRSFILVAHVLLKLEYRRHRQAIRSLVDDLYHLVLSTLHEHVNEVKMLEIARNLLSLNGFILHKKASYFDYFHLVEHQSLQDFDPFLLNERLQ